MPTPLNQLNGSVNLPEVPSFEDLQLPDNNAVSDTLNAISSSNNQEPTEDTNPIKELPSTEAISSLNLIGSFQKYQLNQALPPKPQAQPKPKPQPHKEATVPTIAKAPKQPELTVAKPKKQALTSEAPKVKADDPKPNTQLTTKAPVKPSVIISQEEAGNFVKKYGVTEQLGKELSQRLTSSYPDDKELVRAALININNNYGSDAASIVARQIVNNVPSDGALKGVGQDYEGAKSLNLVRAYLNINGAAYQQELSRVSKALAQPQSQQAQPVKTQAQTDVKEVAKVSNGKFQPVTTDQIRKIMPIWNSKKFQTPEMQQRLQDYTNRLNDTMEKYGINKPTQQAMFLATVGEETGGMTLLTEIKSDYKSSTLVYKGRGIIQLTLEDNYRKASKALKFGEPPNYDLLVKHPELAAEPEYSFPIAGWFWGGRTGGRFNQIPNNLIGDKPKEDLRDFRESSSLVNSGQPDGKIVNWRTRLEYYKRALDTLDIPVSKELATNLDQTIEQYKKIKELPAEPSFNEWYSKLHHKKAQHK